MKTLIGIALAALVLIAGCSGGKQEGTEQAAQVPPAQQPQTTPAPADPAPVDPAPKPVEQAKPPAPKPETKPAVDQGPTTSMLKLPAGYAFKVTLDEPISTETHKAGAAFVTRLTEPAVMKTAGVVIPAGSKIRGEVTHSQSAPRVGGKAQLTLEYRELTTPAGQAYPIYAEALVLEGESTTSGDVQKVVGGTVGGAIIGGLLGGKEGAIKGAAGGAAGGAAWAVATRGNDIVVEPGQAMLVTLSRDIRVQVTVPAGNQLP